eukprot:PhM_4_TR17388/c2_g1_i1/m.32971
MSENLAVRRTNRICWASRDFRAEIDALEKGRRTGASSKKSVVVLSEHAREFRREAMTSVVSKGSAFIAKYINTKMDTTDVRALSDSLMSNAHLPLDAPNTRTLFVLNLSGCGIGASGMASLARALIENKTISKLNLCGNNLRSQGAKELSGVLRRNTSLRHIDVSLNHLEDAGCDVLCSALSLNTRSALTHLDLSTNDLGPRSARSLAKCIEWTARLKSINIWRNKLGAKIPHESPPTSGANVLLQAFFKHDHLTHLDLRYNYVMGTDVHDLVCAFERQAAEKEAEARERQREAEHQLEDEAAVQPIDGDESHHPTVNNTFVHRNIKCTVDVEYTERVEKEYGVRLKVSFDRKRTLIIADGVSADTLRRLQPFVHLKNSDLARVVGEPHRYRRPLDLSRPLREKTATPPPSAAPHVHVEHEQSGDHVNADVAWEVVPDTTEMQQQHQQLVEVEFRAAASNTDDDDDDDGGFDETSDSGSEKAAQLRIKHKSASSVKQHANVQRPVSAASAATSSAVSATLLPGFGDVASDLFAERPPSSSTRSSRPSTAQSANMRPRSGGHVSASGGDDLAAVPSFEDIDDADICGQMTFLLREMRDILDVIKELSEKGSPSDEDLQRLEDERGNYASTKRDFVNILDGLGGRRVASDDDDGEFVDLVKFMLRVILDEGDLAQNNLNMLTVMMRNLDVDLDEIINDADTLPSLCGAGNERYLDAVLTHYRTLSLVDEEVVPSACFSQSMRIPLVATLLRHENRLRLDDDDVRETLVDILQDFLEDISSAKRLIPKECLDGRYELIELLLAHPRLQLSVEREGPDGDTMFSRVAKDGDVILLDVVLSLRPDVDINRVQGDDTTALIQAVSSRHAEYVKRLLALPGIDVTHKCEAGSALDIAQVMLREHPDVISMIQEKM